MQRNLYLYNKTKLNDRLFHSLLYAERLIVLKFDNQPMQYPEVTRCPQNQSALNELSFFLAQAKLSITPTQTHSLHLIFRIYDMKYCFIMLTFLDVYVYILDYLLACYDITST